MSLLLLLCGVLITSFGSSFMPFGVGVSAIGLGILYIVIFVVQTTPTPKTPLYDPSTLVEFPPSFYRIHHVNYILILLNISLIIAKIISLQQLKL